MNKKPSVAVIATLLLVNACGSRVGAWEQPVEESVSVAANASDERSVDESIVDRLPVPVANASAVVDAEDDAGPSDTELDAPTSVTDPQPPADTVASTTTTTTTAPIQDPTTTTQPQAEVDLDALTEALRELDALLGLFEGQVASIDLDETEGETP